MPGQNIKDGYFLITDHSKKCKNLFITNSEIIETKDNKKISNDKQKFIEDYENIMNTSEIFDRNLYKEEFKKLYNSQKFNFSIDNNFLSAVVKFFKKM